MLQTIQHTAGRDADTVPETNNQAAKGDNPGIINEGMMMEVEVAEDDIIDESTLGKNSVDSAATITA